ncbi:MAG TPA: leucyl aminopeptidase [Candidatus Limnocylindrales bacterium]|nr:leucyl aminopeptidase [Candidatus Limnocylindrales bacterium]
MQVRVVTDQPWDVAADVLVVPIAGAPDWSDGRPLGELDRRARGALQDLAEFGELRPKRFDAALSRGGDGIRAARLLAVGAGEPGELDAETARRVAATAERRLAGRTATRMAVWLEPLAAALDGGAVAAAEAVARGVVEGGFEPKTLYREETDSAPARLDELVLVAPTGTDTSALEAAARRGQVIGEGSNLARSLANRSAAEISPEGLAEEARSIARAHGLWIDVIDEKRAAELGMGMFLAVGRGSDNPPRMIVMRSGGEGERDARDRHLAIVGKGVCFDSGGISIKPSDRMEEMKMDKTGACTVIAAIATVARLAPGTPLLAVAPAVENMPGPHSTRPGDVVKALNGKYVDITNTDAEGRLILGDAMTYAEQLGATHLVDVATLTGAVARAFGHLVTGAFGTPQAWYDEVAAAGRRAGERYWQVPLVDEYMAEMDSWYGDLVNASASNDAGLIKSALFLREFRTVPWVHLDIAGTAYYRKAAPYAPRGASGSSLATLVELALDGAPGAARESRPAVTTAA